MARKNDSFYFDGFKQSADYACQAAHLLSEVMHHYEPDRLLERFDEMHRIEQAADEVRHGMMDELVTAFITPFDRDDIARLSSVLDDVTACITTTCWRSDPMRWTWSTWSSVHAGRWRS